VLKLDATELPGTDCATGIDISADGSLVAVARYARPQYISALTASHGGRLLAVCGSFIEIRDLRRDVPVATIPALAETTKLTVDFLPDDRSIAVYGHVEDYLVALSLPDLRELRRWPAPSRAGRVVAISPDGGYLFAASDGVYGQFLYRLAAVAWNNSDALVATLRFDGWPEPNRLALWDWHRPRSAPAEVPAGQ